MPEGTPATVSENIMENNGNWFANTTFRKGREKYMVIVPNVWGTTDKSVFMNLSSTVIKEVIEKLSYKKPKTGRIKGDHPIKELARKMGGMKILAQNLNVTPQTVHRWTTENPAPPHKRTLERLQELGRQHGIEISFATT